MKHFRAYFSFAALLLAVQVLSQNLYPVKKGAACSYINRTGEVLFPYKTGKCMPAEDGVALRHHNGYTSLVSYMYESDAYTQLIPHGDNRFLAKKDQKWIYLLAQPQELIKLGVFDSVRQEHIDKHTWFYLYANDKLTIADPTGHLHFKNLFSYAENIGSGWFKVKNQSGWGIRSVEGKVFLANRYDSIQFYKGGSIYFQNGKAGYKKYLNRLNASGNTYDKLDLKPVYNSIHWYSDSVLRLDLDGNIQLYNTDNKQVYVDHLPEHATYLAPEFHQLKQGEKYMLLDKSGTPLTDALYDAFIYSEASKRIIFRKGKLWGLMDEDGRELLPARVHKIYSFTAYGINPRTFTRYYHNGKYGLVNKNGTLITEAQFSHIDLIEDNRAACMNPDSSAVVYILNPENGEIDDWYELLHINQLAIDQTIYGTDYGIIKRMLVQSGHHSYYSLDNQYDDKKKALLEEPYVSIDKVKIRSYEIFRLGVLNENTEAPDDTLFGLVAFSHKKNDILYKTETIYNNIELIEKQFLLCIKGTDSLYMDLAGRKANLTLKAHDPFFTNRYRITGHLSGNEHYPVLYNLANRVDNRTLLTTELENNKFLKAIYHDMELMDSVIFGKIDSTWELANDQEDIKLPDNTLDVSTKNGYVLSKFYEPNYYFYTAEGNNSIQLKDVEILEEGNGLILIRYNDSLYNYITSEATFLLDSAVEKATPFVNGFASMKKDNRYLAINTQGEIVVEQPQIHPLEYNLAGLSPIHIGKLWGLIDSTGKMVSEAQYKDLKKVKNSELLMYRKPGDTYYSLLTSEGKETKHNKILSAQKLTAGLVLIKSKKGHGLVKDMDAEEVLSAKYKKIEAAGYGIVKMQRKSWGYFSVKAGWKVKEKYISADDFKDGYAEIKDKNERFYLDTLGNISLHKPEINSKKEVLLDENRNHKIIKSDGFIGLTNQEGKPIIPTDYHSVIPLKNNTFLAERKYRHRLQNRNNDTIWESDRFRDVSIVDNLIKTEDENSIRYFDLDTGEWLPLNNIDISQVQDK